jgi:hypothetical protein
MIYKFDKIVTEQIDFYYRNQGNICDFTEYHKELYTNHNKGVRIFRYGNEIITDENVKKDIINKIKKLRAQGIECYMSTSSITPSEYEFHPLTNIHLHWYEYLMRSDISWNTKNGVPFFPVENYNHDKKLNFNKTIKSIFSTRKQSHYRDYLFSKITQDDNCIFRYAGYISSPEKETDNHLETSKNFPSWYELLSDYESSIFSFVYETENGNNPNIDCQVSEKTWLAFMTGTIPIIIGQKNVVKLLKDIGFYVWNDEFGFDDGDELDDYNDRIDKFVTCYNNIKKITFDEGKQYWIDNQQKIQKNYDILSNLITKKWN